MTAVVDACVFLGRSRYGGELTLPSATEQAAALGVRTLVATAAAPPDRDLPAATARLLDAAASSPHSPAGLEGRSSVGRHPIGAGRADTTTTGPVRIAVLARVDPWEPGAVRAARDALAAGAVGLFLHPWEETFRINDHELLGPLMRLLAEAGKPVVAEAGFPWVSEPAQLADLAARHPDVAVVGTRGGHMNMSGLSGQTALRALRAAPNLHLLTSGVYRQDWLRSVVDELGAERLCYGSLAPVLDPRLELARPSAFPEPAVRDQLLSGTATRLFGLPT
ncbi:amidohydrolase family protein [Pseudonocardia acaciae]|uniref:amidohydrolase family protein n=1 Tax=Pseudonocardia acaciae TaxID=551276 RepID=UPI00048C9752|nr:amidohydrolase family protein [Pseudonocardia acaciae]